MIRRAGADDVNAIAAVFRRSFGTLTFLPTLHTPEEDREFFGYVLADGEIRVDEQEGRVLGFAALRGDELSHLYVEPEVHSQGIGSALLDHAKQRRPHGFHLWTFQRNDGARRFYERHGLRLVELTDGATTEEREPDCRYVWVPSA